MTHHSRIGPAVRVGFAASAVLALGLSLFAASATGAEVFISLDETGAELSHPSFVTSTGPAHSAEADLQNGTVKALISATSPAGSPLVGRSLSAGISDVDLVNAGASPIVASSGFLTLALDGAFSFVTAGSGAREANVYINASLDAMLLPAQGGNAQFYNAGFDTSHGWSDDREFYNDYIEISEENGATVTLVQNNASGMIVYLAMPTITLNPNDTLRISLRMFTGVNASNGLSATNDFFNTARLSLVLPPDAVVNTNAGVPLEWLSTEVPAPPAMWLFATGLAGVLGACRRRRA
jgi:hypothetical protein